MSKILTLLTLFVSCYLFSHTTVFGGVAGLSFRKNNVKDSIHTTDTLTNRLMKYRLVKDPAETIKEFGRRAYNHKFCRFRL